MKPSLSKRQVAIVNWNDSKIEIIHPELTVLLISTPGAGKRHMDVGALCYLTRCKKKNPFETSSTVDIASFRPERLPIVLALIEYLRGVTNGNSASSIFHKFNLFFDWIDSQEHHYTFDEVTSLKNMYRDYTQHLLHRINTSGINGNPIRRQTAGQYQAAARIIVMLGTDLSDPTVRAIATYIPVAHEQTKHPNTKLPSTDTQARTFAALVNFIEEAHRVLVDSGDLPMHLRSPNDEDSYLYSTTADTGKSKLANFSMAPLLNISTSFPTWDEAKAHFSITERGRAIKSKRAIYDNARLRHQENNENPRSNARQNLAKHAVVAGLLAFIAATGCNLSVAVNLEVDTLELIPTSKGSRFSGTKGRANGKTVYPEFGSRFSPTFKKYLDIRKWILDGVESPLIFPFISPQLGIIRLNGSKPLGLKKIFSKLLPKTVWVTPTQWRKNLSYQYVKISGGDTILAAEKLGNSEITLRQNYTRPAFDDYAKEMALFFESMHKAAIDRTRSIPRIPVRIAGENPGTATGIGSCEKVPDTLPKLASGFTEHAPLPVCRMPETCLFCEFYAVHADEQDIRRLLSLRYLILAIKNKQPFDHWQIKFGPSLHRIEEVLSAIKTSDKSLKSTISRVQSEVESGALDSFWAIHFDTLIAIGLVS